MCAAVGGEQGSESVVSPATTNRLMICKMMTTLQWQRRLQLLLAETSLLLVRAICSLAVGGATTTFCT